MSPESIIKHEDDEDIGVGEPVDHNPSDVNDQIGWGSWMTYGHRVDSLINASSALRRSGRTNLFPELLHLLFGKRDGD